MEWNGNGWNGMAMAMEWNGMEWNGMEWNGMVSRERLVCVGASFITRVHPLPRDARAMRPQIRHVISIDRLQFESKLDGLMHICTNVFLCDTSCTPPEQVGPVALLLHYIT